MLCELTRKCKNRASREGVGGADRTRTRAVFGVPPPVTQGLELESKVMYRDDAKRRQTERERQRRYRAMKRGVTPSDVTPVTPKSVTPETVVLGVAEFVRYERTHALNCSCWTCRPPKGEK